MALAFCAACKPDECMLTGALFVNSFSPQIKQPQGKSLNSSRSIYITGELKVNVIAELDGQDRKKKNRKAFVLKKKQNEVTVSVGRRRGRQRGLGRCGNDFQALRYLTGRRVDGEVRGQGVS